MSDSEKSGAKLIPIGVEAYISRDGLRIWCAEWSRGWRYPNPMSLNTGVTIGGRRHSLARLVALAWLPNPEGYKYVYRKVGFSNDVSNLVWCATRSNSGLNTGVKKFERKVRCIETKQVFPNTSEAARAFGCTRQAISMVCRGKLKSVRGFSFIYLTPKYKAVGVISPRRVRFLEEVIWELQEQMRIKRKILGEKRWQTLSRPLPEEEEINKIRMSIARSAGTSGQVK